ncbi:MAG: TrmH family RNA methyltransferase [Acidimicrobiales bacterium]
MRRRRAGHVHDRRAVELSRLDRPTAPVEITDPSDPRVADYVGLRDPELRRRFEAGHGILIAEGAIAIRALLGSPYPVRSLLVTGRQWDALAADVAAVGCQAPVYLADRSVLAAVAGFDLHRGAVAAADRPPLADPAALLSDRGAGPSMVAVVEAVNDHENLGALFRNAAAFGVAAVLLDPTCADPLYRRSVRVSLGHALRVPFARLKPWPDRLDLVRTAGFDLVALTPTADAEPIDELAADLGDRVAFLLGAEGPGLSGASLAAAGRRVRIPMAHGVDSLNVATAAAVAFHLVRANRGQVSS